MQVRREVQPPASFSCLIAFFFVAICRFFTEQPLFKHLGSCPRLFAAGISLCFLPAKLLPFTDVTYIIFQIDQNAREDFNLTSDVEFNSIKSLILGRVQGK